jgi:hypothetical protein
MDSRDFSRQVSGFGDTADSRINQIDHEGHNPGRLMPDCLDAGSAPFDAPGNDWRCLNDEAS